MDIEQMAVEFREKGFVVIPGFFSPSEAAALNAEVEAHYAPYITQMDDEAVSAARGVGGKFECDVIGWDPCSEGNSLFMALRDRPELRAVTQACLGENFTEPGSLVMWSTPGGRGQSWHQDCPPEQGEAFNLNRLFYVKDVTLEDGAVVVMPDSHRRGRIPPGGHQEPMDGEVILMPAAGTLVLLHGHVYHRVTPNLSGRSRVSINFRAFPAGIAPEVCDIGIYRNGVVNFSSGELTPVISSGH